MYLTTFQITTTTIIISSTTTFVLLQSLSATPTDPETPSQVPSRYFDNGRGRQKIDSLFRLRRGDVVDVVDVVEAHSKFIIWIDKNEKTFSKDGGSVTTTLTVVEEEKEGPDNEERPTTTTTTTATATATATTINSSSNGELLD